MKLSLLLAGALLVPLYLCRIIRLSMGKQLEKYGQLAIKLERCSDKAILGKGMPRMNCGGFEAKLDSSLIPL